MPPRRDTCRSCGQAVCWLMTRHSTYLIVNADTVKPEDRVFDPKAGHISHWASCPQADAWRTGQRRRKASIPPSEEN